MSHPSRITLGTLLLVAVLAVPAHAALQTVGVYDSTDNANAVDVVAGGSSLTLAQATNAIATAFANDLGGVWNFDTTVAGQWDGTARTSVSLTYGVQQSHTLSLTTSDDAYSYILGNPISGSAIAAGWQNQVNFTINTQLTLVAFTQVSDPANTWRTAKLQATLRDNTTMETVASSANTDTFHVLAAAPNNPIVSFKIIGGSFLRVDDLAFIAVPEPSALMLVGLGLVGTLLFRRRRMGR